MKDNRIGEQIKEFREKQNISQAEFGRMLGVNRSLISAWESGKSLPHLKNTLPKICAALNIDFDVKLFEK